MSKKHMGSSVDDFLKEEGIFEEAQAQAVREVVAWQLAEAVKKKKISKNKMAPLLKTSRTQVDRLLSGSDMLFLGATLFFLPPYSTNSQPESYLGRRGLQREFVHCFG